MQHYFSRGGWRGEQGERKAAGPCSPLTDWVLLPKSLAEHSDPLLRVYYSHRNMVPPPPKARCCPPAPAAALLPTVLCAAAVEGRHDVMTRSYHAPFSLLRCV